MTELPTAHIHRIHGHVIAPPRRWEIPGLGLLRFMVGIWPATLTAVAAAMLVVTSAL
jgi:hypothetical protein